MTSPESGEVTRILTGAEGLSREEALERLLPVVYDELRALAQARLHRERPDHTLQATALVHEAYIRLVGWGQQPWANRAHFYRAAAEAMRRILIEHARGRGRIKRGVSLFLASERRWCMAPNLGKLRRGNGLCTARDSAVGRRGSRSIRPTGGQGGPARKRV